MTLRARVVSLLAVRLLACAPDDDQGVSYLACGEAAACPSDQACVLGLCIARCGDGPACVEGEVCQDDDTCANACDDAHPCTQAFTCIEGACAADPCAHPGFWPHSLESAALPVVVHYRDDVERAEAQRSLDAIERSWEVETATLGFSAPHLDGGLCGPDERFDVYIWRSYRGGVSDVIAENPDTAWDDRINYVIVDPWGPYGGAVLEVTVAHEVNHAMQAVDDWNETPIFFEMTAQFVEDQVYDEANVWIEMLHDFQARPEWALDYNDDYETLYFYGSALYLFYLCEAVFGGDASFISEVWRRCRNPPGANEPDMADALDRVLRERGGSTYEDSLVGFARWRWSPRGLDETEGFEETTLLPEDAKITVAATLRAGDLPHDSNVMVLGSRYFTVGADAGQTQVLLRLDGDPNVRWVVQTVRGLQADEDGAPLRLPGGATPLELGAANARTIVVTALPLTAAGFDPETRTPETYSFQLQVEPLP